MYAKSNPPIPQLAGLAKLAVFRKKAIFGVILYIIYDMSSEGPVVQVPVTEV